MSKSNQIDSNRTLLIEKLRKAPLKTIIDGMKACPACHATGEKNGKDCPCCHGEMIFPGYALFRTELGNWDDPEEAAMMAEIAIECLKY
ncbi:MAG: hypothetical protein Q7S53_01945 [bacterium]|nr:hypothetical protein [bacterium]